MRRDEPTPGPADFLQPSALDRALTWYRGELPLRRLVALFALPALVGLTGLGLLTDPGPISWVMAVLAFVTGAELVTTSARLRQAGIPAGPAPDTFRVPLVERPGSLAPTQTLAQLHDSQPSPVPLSSLPPTPSLTVFRAVPPRPAAAPPVGPVLDP